MSAALLRQMLEEAGAFLKEAKYDKALDAARRVTQFDASNFQAFMCVGLANYNLKQWEDAETAFRRASDLKPDLPAPWKNLVDVFDASGDAKKKVDVLEKLIAVFQKGNKIKPAQKWIGELATTALSLKFYGKAFDAWYSLVNDKEGSLCVDVTPNDELPSSLVLWLQLLDIVQLPAFNLSDSTANVTMTTLSEQFFAVAQRWNWSESTQETESLRFKTDTVIAMFMRFQLNQVKAAKAGAAKKTELTRLDALTSSLVQWFTTSKLPMEYLLLRSEDQDSPLDESRANALAAQLAASFTKSPLTLVYQGEEALKRNATAEARDLFVEALASSSASSFHESALCVRAHMALATIAMSSRDVEGCLSRLTKAREIVAEKAKTFGCAPPRASIFSEVKAQLLEAQAHNVAGAQERALEAYQRVLESTTDPEAATTACVGAAEVLCATKQASTAQDTLESLQIDLDDAQRALIGVTRAWVSYQLDDLDSALKQFQEHVSKLSTADNPTRARAFKRLAIVYWHVGGTHRSDKQLCFGNLLQAAKLAPQDGEVFSWLGQWYLHVGQDVVRAEKCFLKALTLSPLDEPAGVALSDLYAQQGKTGLNVKLWQDLTAAPESAPTWALLRLAQYLVDTDDEQAVGKLHLVLRNDPLNATYWVAMGHVYRQFGKLVAAQRSYMRAIELGESGWCVLTELARIEGLLNLFEEALTHIQQALEQVEREAVAESIGDVVRTIYAELLFHQAKYLNGEGLYGRAASDLHRAKTLLEAVSEQSIPVLKLVGDVHSFAFYLSPHHFTEPGWIDVLATSRAAYAKIVDQLKDDASSTSRAEAYYDLGVSCWYEARARCSATGVVYNAFARTPKESLDAATEVAELLSQAKSHFRAALEAEPSFGLAWNALGVVLDHPIAKQFAWIRAIQTSNSDVAWANLGLLYLETKETRLNQLARNAFLHLQAVNAHNPTMWIGYGMLYLQEQTAADHIKAREAFQCALEMGFHLDALQGLVLSSLVVDEDKDTASESAPSDETLLFSIKKYLEREPFNAGAWNVLSVLQYRLGLDLQAAQSAQKSLELEESGGVEVNNNVYELSQMWATEKAAELEKAYSGVLQAVKTSGNGAIVGLVLAAEKAYRDGKHSLALSKIQSAVAATEGTSASTRVVVANVALSLAALCVTKQPSEAQSVADACVAVLVDRLTTTSNKQAQADVSALELYHRATNSLASFVSTMRGISGDNSSMSLALASIDIQSEAAFISGVTSRAGDVEGQAVAQALKALMTTSSTKDAMKLVRLDPSSPYAYAVAALGLIKHNFFRQDHEGESKKSVLDGAIRLLKTGLVASQNTSASAFATVLLQYALAFVHSYSGQDEPAKTHAETALAKLGNANLSAADRSLWQARLLALTADSSGAVTAYQDAIKTLAAGSDSSPRVLATLYELGNLLESAKMFDAALLVWKTVGSFSSGADAETLDAPRFMSTLRLAIVLGKKQNTKSAKSFVKTAVKLVSSDEASPAATVARFVENVVTKM
ncbi:hypothetical protein Poli38472_000921 [Pythium oligandrum]|uniref:Superkiller protein 3 n=1 Tax=Pythium oligandrum TaxID=41045 RepID=A0A8K1CCJ2_PYTOL|nr:hypothetical protein Poli38472_000921 [Pythium oligandrum]|eukprot:TMW60879.1 hypothetical protein Poli38472_000921 [Pythium oligandrum]